MGRVSLIGWVVLAVWGGSGTQRSASAAEAEAPWRVGLAAVRITPDQPMPLGGYGPRVSDGVLDELYAKAFAVESPGGERAVLLTADLLFFRAPQAEAFAQRITQRTGLLRRQLLLNASHTHASPLVGINADLDAFGVPAELRTRVQEYTEKLGGQMENLVAAALADLQPARLAWGIGRVDFPVHRRVRTAQGVVMAANPAGLVDRRVPVLRIDRLDGRLRGLIFGCACHPATLDGANRKVSGDYAGQAQQEIERLHPGVQAMFVAGCGGDANPHPRGGAQQEQLVRQHAQRLAAEVVRAAHGPLAPVRGRLRAELQWTELPLQQPSRAQLEAMAGGASAWHARNARGMLAILDSGQPLPPHYRAALAAWQFGDDLTLLALPGEAVAGYVPLLERAVGTERLWIAAYANESFGYLPTAEIVAEGGHESMGLTLDIGLFAPTVEDAVVTASRQVAQRAGRAVPASPP